MANHASTPQTQEVVDPRWLLKAGAVTLAVAMVCGWLTLWLLFYQGQWQFALHPSRTVSITPAALQLPFESVRFGVDATGTPQLTGWWIPSDTPGALTGLLLHGGEGSLSEALPLVQRLHTARLNVFVFDYRGFGASGGAHPDERMMQTDADSALGYLTTTRGIAPNRVILVGQGIAASLATSLAASHSQIPAIILDAPIGDIEASVARDPRTRMVPTGLLLHEHFTLAAPLRTLKTPKLLLRTSASAFDVRAASDPKMTVELPATDSDPAYVQAVVRFLDSYAPHP